MEKNYCNIGKLVASFGVKGDMVLQHQLGKKTSLKGAEVLFVEMVKDEMMPYFVESTKIRSADEIFIKFEGVDTPEAAKKLLRKEIWLPEEDFKKYASKTSPVSMLGYHLINEDEDIGEVLEVIEQPHQILCRIEFNGREALIPVHEETLVKVNKKSKQVFLTLPDGLLDIYRE